MNRHPPAFFATLIFLLTVGLSWMGWLDSYTQLILMFMGVNIILSTSLNLINGYMGEFSCGHAGFMAVGAYVTSLLTVWFFTEGSPLGPALLTPQWAIILFPFLLLLGGLAAALAGLMVAIPSFRTRGDYLAIITLAANYIIKSAIENIQVIGGARGFMGMSRVVNGMDDFINLPWMMIWICFFVFLTILMIKRFVGSTYGKGILAIREDEISAEIMGVNTQKAKMVAFMFSSGLAGIAGGSVRPYPRVYQPGKLYDHEIHRGPGHGLSGRHGLFERIGLKRRPADPDPGNTASPAGLQMGSGAASPLSVDAFPAGRVARSQGADRCFSATGPLLRPKRERIKGYVRGHGINSFFRRIKGRIELQPPA